MITLPDWTEKAAHFSDVNHRVWLRRRIEYHECAADCVTAMNAHGICPHAEGHRCDDERPRFVFIGYNPSIAGGMDDLADDPTSRRCISFARACGASDMVMVNLATQIATDPDDMMLMADPIGPMADEALRVAAAFCQPQGRMIAAWGTPKGKTATKNLMQARMLAVKRMGFPLHYMRLTQSGFPEHPLYLPATLRPVAWDYYVTGMAKVGAP